MGERKRHSRITTTTGPAKRGVGSKWRLEKIREREDLKVDPGGEPQNELREKQKREYGLKGCVGGFCDAYGRGGTGTSDEVVTRVEEQKSRKDGSPMRRQIRR